MRGGWGKGGKYEEGYVRDMAYRSESDSRGAEISLSASSSSESSESVMWRY